MSYIIFGLILLFVGLKELFDMPTSIYLSPYKPDRSEMVITYLIKGLCALMVLAGVLLVVYGYIAETTAV